MRNNFLTLLTLAALVGTWSTMTAQAPEGGPSISGCYDGSQYVNFKNVGVYGGYTLQDGFQERAAQTYHYQGNGALSRIRIYGEYPGLGPVFSTIPLRVVVYNVDASGRPTSTISSTNISWNGVDEYNGYKDANISTVSVSNNFAVAVELRSITDQFRIAYTGDGEGLNEDLASLAGTSTGFNWSSAMTNFSKNGDFRIVPYVMSDLDADFNADASCVSTGQTISFSNNSRVETGGMFNVINRSGYTGSNTNYSWDFGDGTTSTATNPTKSYSTVGRKTVTLTIKHEKWDGSFCSDVYSMDISVGLALTSAAILNASCYGAADGTATANVTGGASPYIYSLDGGSWVSSNVFNGLPAGSHTIAVRDDLGCQSSTNFTITQPTAVVFSTSNTTNASCGQATGAIFVSASGGTAPITYSLDGGTAQASGSFPNLTSGAYAIEAEDANGCTAEISVVVNDQGAPSIVLLSATNISCNGGNDGTITVLGSGGTGALQYSVNGVNYQSNNLFGGLTAGTYTVTVRDAAGCTRGFPLTLTEPNALTLGRIIEQEPVSCNGGNDGVLEIINSIGGIGIHSYSVNGVNFQTNRVFNGLSAGTYTITVRDAAGCTATATATVTQPTALVAATTQNNLSCNGSNDGVVTVNVSGGNYNYQYQLSGTSTWQFSNTFNDLAAGTYTILVKDEKDCRTSVVVTITQPNAITGTITVGSATCGGTDGTASIVAAGGSGSGYQYSINQGASFQASGAFTNLGAGTYSIIVRDGTGCYNAFTAVINSTTGPSINSLSKSDITCYMGSDGAIFVTAVGGTGALSYSISGPYQSSGTFTDLSAGFYNVSVRDAVGCFDSDTITLNQGNPIAVTATVTNNVSCYGGNNGTVSIAAAGGIGTLAYSLNGTTFQSVNTFSGLVANTLYTVYVRDAGACTNFTNFSVTQPSQIIANVGVLNGTCAGADNGSIFATASGGTGTLQYSINGTTYGATNTWTNLEAANYVVYVRDANNCTVSILTTVTEPMPIALNAFLDQVNCAGGNDGAISLSVSGGVEPYAYAWSNGSTREDIFNLEAGSYAVIVADANGCTATNAYTISAPATPIILNGTVANASASSVADGAIDLTVTGGTSPYNYEWSNGALTQDIDSITSGFYIVIVTDASGCETSQIFTVSFGSSVEASELANAEVRLYPNPAQTYTTVAVSGFGTNVIENVRVIDALGQLVYSVQANSDKVQLNTAELSAGLYLIQVEVAGQRITQKLNVTK